MLTAPWFQAACSWQAVETLFPAFMTTSKQRAIHLFRQLRILKSIDYLRYLAQCVQHHADNQSFVAAHPALRLPPLRIAYDAYGHTNWSAYLATGLEHAKIIRELIRKYASTHDGVLAVCEWGCGPARILRHLPALWPSGALELHGFDYNAASITWCRENIPGIRFELNALEPPLEQPDNSLDCLYGVSVFTHLSRELHDAWMQEISRVVKPGGLMILTTHGDTTRANLLVHEQALYDRGELVVRDKAPEGKRTFVAYQPPAYMRHHLLSAFDVLAHIPPAPSSPLRQDIWVVRNVKR